MPVARLDVANHHMPQLWQLVNAKDNRLLVTALEMDHHWTIDIANSTTMTSAGNLSDQPVRPRCVTHNADFVVIDFN